MRAHTAQTRSPSAAHMTEILLKAEATSCNMTQNEKGETALMKAIEFRNIGAILQLGSGADQGDNWELKNKKGKTACDLARDVGFNGLKEVLVLNQQNKVNEESPTPIFAAVRNKNVELVELFCSSGLIDVNKMNGNKLTALSLILFTKYNDIPTGSLDEEDKNDDEYEKRKSCVPCVLCLNTSTLLPWGPVL